MPPELKVVLEGRELVLPLLRAALATNPKGSGKEEPSPHPAARG